MSIQVHLRHLTRYRYDRRVRLSPQVIRLRPAPHARTPVLDYSLRISPEPHFLNWQQDPFGNWLARVVFPEPCDHFEVEVGLAADLRVINPFDFFLEEHAQKIPFDYDSVLKGELAPYLVDGEHGSLVDALLAEWKKEADAIRTTVDWLVGLNRLVHRKVAYTIRMEPGVQGAEETLRKGSGSCRDSAWLLVQMLRRLGLAARFVSGYLIQLVPDEKPVEGPEGPASDFTDLHAWAEVFLPGAGWVGLDATSGLLAGEGHIPLSATPLPQSSAAITGYTDPCECSFDFAMEVRRLPGPSRVTAPYEDGVWERIRETGRLVDEDLDASDARLTQGGEPTFVADDRIEDAEWNTTALGSDKSAKGLALFLKLRARWAPGGVLHFGQGKWYPGEPLPRWVYTAFSRTDGAPLWHREDLLAVPGAKGTLKKDDAEPFVRRLAEVLGVTEEGVQPCYEDFLYYLWAEGNLPPGFAPDAAALGDDLERKRLRAIFDEGLGKPVAWILPLHAEWKGGEAAWTSGAWALKRGRAFLVPGDSPAGLRLPLNQLIPAAPDDIPPDFATTPLDRRGALPNFRALLLKRMEIAKTRKKKSAADKGPSNIRTTLVGEVRDGLLHVFLPPVSSLEVWCELIGAVESVAEERKTPVVIEGYEPPKDARLTDFKITPDPGVLEINVPPVSGWDALERQTTEVYEAAKLSHLRAEKFALDGRHTGSGGGHHITLGAAHPSESLFLRRPDVLRSMVTFWQHHPSLSYLFSGLFLGPTSQAPRVDEARLDSLFELGIALREVDRLGDAPQFWQIDRALRNHLIDATGNTHRAEFSIDKLYSPDSPTGRLGLVELRGFEMAPHPRMALVQMLLVRSLVAVFARSPYRLPPQPWGTALHDRFMLPSWIEADLQEVLAFVRRHGIGLDPLWFRPFVEFRFPSLGKADGQGLEMELRAALEPWHVLGEESAAGGTARYVDSSLERVELRVRGLPPGLGVAVNGVLVPLQDGPRRGEKVCGVRYKAWAPYSALHPSIGIHSPLAFQAVDLDTGLPRLSATYHVVHPGGRSYDRFPVNANEAEARRASRFETRGRGMTPVVLRTPPPNADFPHTLDLRTVDGGKR